LKVVCGEHGIGGDGEYCGGNDAHLGRFNVFYHEASGGKYVPRAAIFDLEPGVIGAVRASPLGEFSRQGNLVNENAGAATTGPRPTTQRLGTNSAESPCGVAAFVVKSESHTGARPSVRLCGGHELTRCVHLV
jgi:hypothetical protein